MTKGKPEFTKRMTELLEQGLSQIEIEDRLGVSHGTISSLVWRLKHPKQKEPYQSKPKKEYKQNELPDRHYHPKWEEKK